MKKAISRIFAVVLAAGASVALAQTSAEGSHVLSSPVSPLAQPSPPGSTASTSTLPPAPNFPAANCDRTGCWGADGTRYNRVGGNLVLGTNGRMYHVVAPGAPLMCS